MLLFRSLSAYLLIFLFLVLSVRFAYAGDCWHRKAASYGQVAEVTGDGVVVLIDGRRLGLSNLALPFRPMGLAVQVRWDVWDAYLAEVKRLLTGRNIVFFPVMFRPDRYGVLPAHIYIEGGSKRVWVQKSLVSKGLVRVDSGYGAFDCVGGLLKVEDKARSGKRGLWTRRTYLPLKVQDVRGLLRRRNSFVIVEGRVRNVAEVRGRIYLNFGRDWRRDFTVKISRRNWRVFRDLGIRAENYEGKSIRVRGWVVLRNGPLIEVEHPSLIEVVESSNSSDGK